MVAPPGRRMPGGAGLPRLDLHEHLQVVRLYGRSGARIGLEAAREAGEAARVEDAPQRAREEREAGCRVDEGLLQAAAHLHQLGLVGGGLEAAQKARRLFVPEAVEVGRRLLADRAYQQRIELAAVELVGSRAALGEPDA